MKHRVFAALAALFVLLSLPAASAQGTEGSGGPLTDRTFQSFTGSRYTSQYHLYAAGLDWTKPVGLLLYADGSGEYGLKNPGSSYLLAGSNGLINVAKQRNMVLLTPISPNKACSDGGGSCWYLGDPTGYAQWSYELVQHVYSQYRIDTARVAFGGYSSGAQWTTEFFGPLYGSKIMTDGVAVAISYGGSPKVTSAFSSQHKAAVPYVWDTGDKDAAWTTTGSYGVKAGHDWYKANGFTTQLHLVAGMGHSRSDFGRVMAREIDEHVPAGTTAPAPTPTTTPAPTTTTPTTAPAPTTTAPAPTTTTKPAPTTTTTPTTKPAPTTTTPTTKPAPTTTAPSPVPYAVRIEPTRVGASFTVDIPAGAPATTVRVSPDFAKSSGWYLTHTRTGTQVFDFTPYRRLSPKTTYQYRIEAGSPSKVVATGTFTTTA